MRKDHRPYWLKRAYLKFQAAYAKRFLHPQFDAIGGRCVFIKPWHVEIFGSGICVGGSGLVIAASDRKIRLSVWSAGEGMGSITIGDYFLLSPGARIGSADRITIGDNCMIASNAYITDSDWHGIYDRVDTGKTAPVTIEENVWIGDSAIVCKGVTIGSNSVIGAGAVVAGDIPANVVAAGNPARVIRELDRNEPFIKRQHLYGGAKSPDKEFAQWDRLMLSGNTLAGWMRYLVKPGKKD